ncbi:MAG: ABC transporter permease [Hydrogeniiclostridium sp.]
MKAKAYEGQIAPKKRGFIRNIRRYWMLYVMFLPVIICLLLFNYLPMTGIYIAFTEYQPWVPILESPFVGLENFRLMFTAPDFGRLVFNTVWINILKLVFGFPAPIILALLLNEVQKQVFKRTFQTISYLPYFVSWIVVSGIMYTLLNYNFGIVNGLLKSFGMEPVQWYTSNQYWRSFLVGTSVWKSIGYNSILYLAAIAGIDTALYEAAVIDGASRWKQMLHITLPCLLPTASILLILSLGSMMNGDFGQIFALIGQNAPLHETTDVLDFYIYRKGLQSGQFSIGTAMGLFQSVIGFILIVGSNLAAKRMGGEGIW